jgi:hypothetical protein
MTKVPAVQFERILPGPIERVWQYLTDPTHDAERELVARRHMDVVASRQGLAVHQPLLVHGQADKPAGPQREDIAGIGVARILDPHHRALIHQERRQEIDRMLGADREQDLLRCHEDAPARQQQGADLLDELRIVVGEAVARPFAHGGEAEGLARAFPPICDGKEGRVDLRGRELQLVALEISEPDLGVVVLPPSDPVVVEVPAAVCTSGDYERRQTATDKWLLERPLERWAGQGCPKLGYRSAG